VRVPTTNYGVRNPGLMQDHDGGATCNDNGYVQTPCPSDVILQMVRDGTAGTDAGDGLANCLNGAANWNPNGGDDADFYRAARIYNSGSIADSGNLEEGIATHCYSSDIAKYVWNVFLYHCHSANHFFIAVLLVGPMAAMSATSTKPVAFFL